MVLLRDVVQVVAHFGPFEHSVHLSPRLVHGLRQMYPGHRNQFGHTEWYYYVMCVIHFSPFRDIVNLGAR
jgi:hypothetical protein